MYLDGRWLGSHAANFAQFPFMLGQLNAQCGARFFRYAFLGCSAHVGSFQNAHE